MEHSMKPTKLSFMIGYPDALTIGWPDYIGDHLRWDLKADVLCRYVGGHCRKRSDGASIYTQGMCRTRTSTDDI
jgi:hypothetical protein